MKQFSFITMLTLFMSAAILAAPSLNGFKDTFARELEEIRTEQTEAKQRLDESYREALTRLLDTRRKAGDLEGYTAIKTEMARFKESDKVPSVKAETEPGLVHDLHEAYRSKADQIRIDSAEKVVALAEDYRKALDKLKKILVIEDRLDEAVATQHELDSVETFREVNSAHVRLKKVLPDPPVLEAPSPAVTETAGYTPLTFTRNLAAWAVEENGIPHGIRAKLSNLPPDASWMLPRASRESRAKRYYGVVEFAEKTRLNIVQEVEPDESIHAWFTFGDDINFIGRERRTLSSRKTKKDPGPDDPMVLEYPIRFPDGEERMHTVSVTMAPGRIYLQSAFLMEGALNLGGTSFRVAVGDRTGSGSFAAPHQTAVYLKRPESDEVIRTHLHHPFPAEGRYYQFAGATASGRKALFEACGMVRVTGTITDTVTGAGLPEARVEIPSIERIISCDANGSFEAELPHGHYPEIILTADRYQPIITSIAPKGPDAIALAINREAANRFDVTLKPGLNTLTGRVTLHHGQAYHFLTGSVTPLTDGGEFYFSRPPSTKTSITGQFRLNLKDAAQLGLADLGDIQTPLDQLNPLEHEFSKMPVPVHEGHTYMTRARKGELNHHIAFKVIGYKKDAVVLEYVYL